MNHRAHWLKTRWAFLRAQKASLSPEPGTSGPGGARPHYYRINFSSFISLRFLQVIIQIPYKGLYCPHKSKTVYKVRGCLGLGSEGERDERWDGFVADFEVRSPATGR